MTKCTLCPRNCQKDRQTELGFCKCTNNVKIANYSLHFGEEPVISFSKGSGTIFFSGCSLKCVYCQNYEVSTNNLGQEISVEELANIFKHFDATADNINLVTPTHFRTQIQQALKLYTPKIPICYNTHSYETIESIEQISKYVDIFLADFKYINDDLSQKYSNVKYFDVATKAIDKMLQLKKNSFDKDGKMLSGVIIRHLVLPSFVDESKRVLDYIKTHWPNALVSIMAQYTPFGKAKDYPEINRKLKREEYQQVLDYACEIKIDGFAQDLSSAQKFYIPKFSQNITLPTNKGKNICK